eukprot:TRINITY_DN6842_c0_g1_i1.p1 TRINITY_DN6842_c0_g1~~TRINITY_DN6842_c0_g1_i1.p1  ORF type:complete len:553 (-),score=174.71 TRINITY_DN6842_c0_g1_i1:284-1942(-)
MMKILLLLAFIAISCLAVPLPRYAPAYHLKANVKLPYVNINMPVEVHYDAEYLHAERYSYYNGKDTYIKNSAQNFTVEYLPRNYNPAKCFFQGDMMVELTNFLPSLAGFKFVGTEAVDNILSNKFEYQQKLGGKVNTYTFYSCAATGKPVRYIMMGYDSLIGSHYDEYVVDYTLYIPGRQSASLFAKPRDMSKCRIGLAGESSGPAIESVAQKPDLMSTLMTSPAAHTKAFKEYVKKYGNEGHLSDGDRMAEFLKNQRFVETFNANNSDYSFELQENHMMSLLDSERSYMRGSKKKSLDDHKGSLGFHSTTSNSINELPKNYNWLNKGVVSDVKDQGICGSCWSFGSAESIESRYRIVTGQFDSNKNKLSQQNLMDCSWKPVDGSGDWDNNACDGGTDVDAYKWMMNASNGLQFADDYGPYLMADDVCHYDGNKPTVQIRGYTAVTPFDEHALMDALYYKGPISIAINASLESFSFYGSGVYDDEKCIGDADQLDHAVLLVGYGTDTMTGKDYWLIQNSWSTHWSIDGLIKIARKNNICGVGTMPTYVELDI